MENFRSLQVGNIVALHPHTAKVFKQYRMDFCCGGDISLQDICTKKNVAVEEIEPKLQEAITQAILPQKDYNNWELTHLIDHIEAVFHRNAKSDIPELQQNLDKVVRVHGADHPHLPAIRILFERLAQDLLVHMQKEEEILFPMIRNNYGAITSDLANKLQAEIDTLHAEHDAAGTILEEIRTLTGNFTPPEGACRTYRLVYQLLEHFEDALHMHVHLENNILFAKINKNQ